MELISLCLIQMRPFYQNNATKGVNNSDCKFEQKWGLREKAIVTTRRKLARVTSNKNGDYVIKQTQNNVKISTVTLKRKE